VVEDLRAQDWTRDPLDAQAGGLEFELVGDAIPGGFLVCARVQVLQQRIARLPRNVPLRRPWFRQLTSRLGFRTHPGPQSPKIISGDGHVSRILRTDRERTEAGQTVRDGHRDGHNFKPSPAD
jgi:hypothetical protein